MTRSRLPLLGLAAALLIFGSACIGAASTRGWAQPAQFQDDVVMVSTREGKLDGIDPDSGSRLWRFPDDWTIWEDDAEDLDGIYGTPIIEGDTVYIADYSGYVYAFKPSEAGGGTVGLFKVGGAIIGGIALEGDYLYVTTDEGRLWALHAGDLAARTSQDRNVRERFARFEAGDRIWTPPVLAGGRVYFGTTDGRLVAIDATSGTQVGDPFKSGAALVSTPVFAGGLVLAGGFDQTLHAIDPSTGQERWNFDVSDWIWSRPLVEDGTVYLADFAGKVYAVSLSDGSPVWDEPFDVGESVRSSPVISGGALVVANEKGDIYGISPRNGSQMWGPVRLGATVHADLRSAPGSTTVFIAPTKCTNEETGRVYYFRLDVSGSTPQRGSTGAVC